jgi:potassium-dependent mechanosensitive channel
MLPLSSSARSARLPGNKSRRNGRALRAVRVLLLLFVALCLHPYSPAQGSNPLGSLLGKKSQAPATPANPAPAEPQPPAAIPLPEVSTRAEELMRLLRDVSNQLPTRDQIDAIRTTLDERDVLLRDKQKEAEKLLAGTPGGLELRELDTFWHVSATEGGNTRRQLLEWANAAQSAVQQLQALQPQWTLTLEANQSIPGLGPTLDVIRDAVKNIQTTQTQAQDLLRLIVNLQVTAANQHQLALSILVQLERSRLELKHRVFQRDTLPLWQVFLRRQQEEPSDFFESAHARVVSIKYFARENAAMFAVLGVLLLLSLFGAYKLAVATRGFQPANDLQARALETTRHWVGLGLLPPLLLGLLFGPFAPLPLIGLAILLSFFPILTLLPPMIEPRFRVPLYCLVGVYLFNAVVIWVVLSPAAKREVQFIGSTAAFVLFAYFLWPKRPAAGQYLHGKHGLVIFGERVALAVLAFAQLANLFGYYKLAQFTTMLCVYSTFIALAAFTAQRVFSLLLLAALEAASAERLAVVRLHRETIARWLPRVLQWAFVLLWLGATLDLVGARTWVQDRISDLFAFNIAGSSSHITLGGVLGLFGILLVGYAISSSIRFLLREELLKRLHLKRGLPELISTTLHYLLLVLVFLFAVNAGGIELNKFTVLTGALGVGVGFGLQNIINNFVSGLILQFERPIRIGDVVDLGAGVSGPVTRIGIRSSTVQTWQGAEVIIPNASFISGNVTNWTLSESRRRVDLPVGVAYGTDPKMLKELLERPAIQHPDVLTLPAPEAFFMGFGESALNFELRFWVMQESNTVKVNSQVALEVMRLLDEAGIEIPFPQRDLRLRAVDAQAAAALSGDGAEREESRAEFHTRVKSAD